MTLRTNAGYIIISSVIIGESEFVLGVNHESGQFVTWKCSNGNYYYWGHYFTDEFAAQKDLIERAQKEIRLREGYEKETECER